MLRLEAIEVTYRVPGQRPVLALAGVDCAVNAGEVVGLLGHNGAGKTTLMRTALGMIRPSNGSVTFQGIAPYIDRHHVLRQVGAILDGERDLRPRWTVREVLEFVGVAHGLSGATIRRQTRALLARLRLIDAENRLVTQLSRGMRQKLSLALALIHEPSLLVLDEPILGLDVSVTAEFLSIVRGLASEGRAVIISSHQLNTLEPILNRVYMLQAGVTVFEGAPEDLIGKVGSGRLRLRFDTHPASLFTDRPAISEDEDGWLIIDNDTAQLAEIFAAANRLHLRLVAIERLVDLEAAYLAMSMEVPSHGVPAS